MQVVDKLMQLDKAFPGRIEALAWAEDLDTSAAVGQLAALPNSIRAVDYYGTDQIKLRKGYGQPRLLLLRWVDETPPGTGGYLEIEGESRKIRFGKLTYEKEGYGELDFSRFGGRPLPEGAKLSCYANKSGSAAEQHVVIAYVVYPNLPKKQTVWSSNPGLRSIYGPLGLKTGTKTAGSFSPLTAEPVTGWEDSELGFPEDPSHVMAILGFINGPGLADSGLVGLRHPDGDLDLYWPASMAGQETLFLECGWVYSAVNPPKLGAEGASTTSEEYGFIVGSNKPYGASSR